MSNIVLIDLVVALRRFCGNPTGKPGDTINPEVTDEDIQRAIRWAVYDINKIRNKNATKIAYIETIADQQSYDIPSDVGEIVKIHYNQSYFAKGSNADYFDQLPSYFINDALMGYVGDRSMGLINEIQDREFHDHSSFASQGVVKDGKIYLDPTPSQSGLKVYYEYIDNSADVEQLDAAVYEKAVYYGAASVILEQILTNRNNEAQVGTAGLQNMLRITDLQFLKNNFDEKFRMELEKIGNKNMGI